MDSQMHLKGHMELAYTSKQLTAMSTGLIFTLHNRWCCTCEGHHYSKTSIVQSLSACATPSKIIEALTLQFHGYHVVMLKIEWPNRH